MFINMKPVREKTHVLLDWVAVKYTLGCMTYLDLFQTKSLSFSLHTVLNCLVFPESFPSWEVLVFRYVLVSVTTKLPYLFILENCLEEGKKQPCKRKLLKRLVSLSPINSQVEWKEKDWTIKIPLTSWPWLVGPVRKYAFKDLHISKFYQV